MLRGAGWGRQADTPPRHPSPAKSPPFVDRMLAPGWNEEKRAAWKRWDRNLRRIAYVLAVVWTGAVIAYAATVASYGGGEGSGGWYGAFIAIGAFVILVVGYAVIFGGYVLLTAIWPP